MSGYAGPGGPGDGNSNGNGLDSLFANLRQERKPVHLESSQSYYGDNNSGYFAPSQQSPFYLPAVPTPPMGPPSHHSHRNSLGMSPHEAPQLRTAPGASSSADRTSNLLNLLKFSQPSSSAAASMHQVPIGTPLPVSREGSASYVGPEAQISSSQPHSNDLMATLMGSVSSKSTQQTSSPLATASQPGQSSHNPATKNSPSADAQAYLLQLLNLPKPQSNNSTQKHEKLLTPRSKADSPEADSPEADVNEITRELGDASLDRNLALNRMDSAATDSLPAFTDKDDSVEPAPKNNSGIFTYVNPFEGLAAFSPRNRTPKTEKLGPSISPAAVQILKNPHHDPSADNKRKMGSGSSSPAHNKRKIDTEESSGPPTPLPDGRTQLEALIGIGASGKASYGNEDTGPEAVSDFGRHADNQSEHTSAGVEKKSQANIEEELREMLAAKTEKESEDSAQMATKQAKKELAKENSIGVNPSSTPVAEKVKESIDDGAHGQIADSWESADAEDGPVKDDDENAVPVYNFPMRPWTSITIQETPEPRSTFREESVMDIARLKKEFDQIDRTLVTASNNFIVYGMSKNGGVRIIRQDDGKDNRLFTETRDRIFSVVLSSSSADQKESIICTGISGTVYWALIKDGESDHIKESNPEIYGFALPPIQTQETECLGGVLKTRARKSSNHPDFFAVGRGKYINIIWPSVIMNQSFLKDGKDRLVDIDCYLAHHSLRVNTGKAGKDFTFSEDDSTIVSLDKAGRVKFWDVRSLTKTGLVGPLSSAQEAEIKDPLVTFTTIPATEKSWPTSVLFIDKLRPYQRGGALRYLIVGMKQNHTLQLWDIALAKPVQEIHLPHTKESDAVCSVVYHAASGMIIVGHPTRNSIYFLHFSAPKYNLPKNVSQAEFIEKFVSGDTSISKPDSTAVISGFREYSLANKGTLRSLDILQNPNSANASDASALFELYCMHSKGVTCLTIKNGDLGWTTENKVIRPIVAEKVGVISIDTLKEIPATSLPELTEPLAPAPVPTRIVPRPAVKEAEMAKENVKKPNYGEPLKTIPKVDERSDKKETSTPNAGSLTPGAPEKTDKKKRRKATVDVLGSSQSHSSLKVPIIDPWSNIRNSNLTRTHVNVVPDSVNHLGMSASPNQADLKHIEKLFTSSLDKLFQDFKTERQVHNATATANQDAMLRMVSATLNDNIEVTLTKIVQRSIEDNVIPALTEAAAKSIQEQLDAKLNAHLASHLPRELQRCLPDVISKALQQPQLLKLISESLAKTVSFRVEEEFNGILTDVVTPAFSNLAYQTTQKVVADLQRQSAEQIHIIEKQRQSDGIKIAQLTQLVTGLSETVSSMAASQAEFQARFLKSQQQAAHDRHAHSRGQTDDYTHQNSISQPSTALTGPTERTREEEEYDNMMASITAAMAAGEYENAVIQWLQTRREQQFFMNYFSKFNPDFIRELSPLLLLSLGATISVEFEGEINHNFLDQRVAWLEAILPTFQSHISAGSMDDQVRNLVPKIMSIYIQRLEHLFMRVSQMSAHDPLLKRLSLLVSAANRVLETVRGNEYGNTSSMSSGRHGL